MLTRTGMTKTFGFLIIGSALAGVANIAHAQMSAAPITSKLPDVRAISAANAAGVLQYCVGEGLTSSATGDLIVSGLMSRPGVAKSPEFATGKAGTILAAKHKSFSIGAAPGYLQSRACDMVLQQAKQL